jgi:hypothetical protein
MALRPWTSAVAGKKEKKEERKRESEGRLGT